MSKFFDGIDLKPKQKKIKSEKKINTDVRDYFSNYGWNYDPRIEFLDVESQWICDKRGNKLRKFCETFNYDYQVQIHYWTGRLDNLSACEVARWNAKLYALREYKKISGVFDEVLNAKKFYCLQPCEKFPKIRWTLFDCRNDANSRSISHNYVDNLGDDAPVNQELGDKWFAYDKRSRQINNRKSVFYSLFEKALNRKYAQQFYERRYRYSYDKVKLLINNREYIIGINERNSFGVLIYPEELITEVVSWSE